MNKLTTLTLLLVGLLAPVVMAEDVNAGKPQQSIVGAIRWDAWYGDAGIAKGETEQNSPGLIVERTLAPAHWHYRIPFYAKTIGENKVEFRGNSPDVMDKEIAYASEAGLDYWAFLTYPPQSPLSAAFDLYLASKRKSEIKFCVILHHIRETPEEVARITGYIKESQYAKVLAGRPLVYAFQCKAGKPFYDDLLMAAAEAGLKRPYLVNMDACSTQVKWDAVSSYTGKGGKGMWDRQKQGQKVIPSVSAGWDPRPRIETPNPWSQYYGNTKGKMKLGRLRSAETDAVEIADGVKSALLWNRQNPGAGEAKAVVIYAWNEFDEGGWICPTLSEGTRRLDAISKVLKEDEKITHHTSAGDGATRASPEK